ITTTLHKNASSGFTMLASRRRIGPSKVVVVPEPGLDVIGGNIIVEASPGSTTFTVTYGGMNVVTYRIWGAGPSPTPSTPLYAWSKKSNVYHHANCSSVQNISPQNLETGNTPPPGKTLHQGCPH